MKRICVFCGSGRGIHPEYSERARDLGRLLARQKIGLVYGGAGVGLMGEMARTALAEGGEVIGVIPKSLAEKEVALKELADLRIVGSMHERKALMSDLSDGFIALPGGLGTIEELFEMLTWAQLGIHKKPCGILNIRGYFNHLISFLDHTVSQQFIQPANRRMIIIEKDIDTLLKKFFAYKPPTEDKAKWALGMKNT
ncbi:MAG: TIGR00730 family Rossman fold protein [Calditrichales bacterium]|nr:MAG: TIGR00730 family Rossman fold protein [Calditrichales bacterium]